MGWQISIKEGKEGDKYKIWSTVTDSYITEKWLDKKEIVKFLFWHKFREFMYGFLQDTMTFPNEFSIKTNGDKMFRDHKVMESYYTFKLKALRDDKLFYATVKKELDDLGIKMDVDDGEYNFKNQP